VVWKFNTLAGVEGRGCWIIQLIAIMDSSGVSIIAILLVAILVQYSRVSKK
jgi:hypothetical protein